MKKAINEELEAILVDIARARATLKQQIELLDQTLETTFGHLSGRIEGEEVEE